MNRMEIMPDQVTMVHIVTEEVLPFPAGIMIILIAFIILEIGCIIPKRFNSCRRTAI